MKSFWLVLAGLCVSTLAYEQSADKYAAVDQFISALHLPASNRSDLNRITDSISKTFQSDEFRARAAFKWVTEHIGYDCGNYSDSLLNRNSIEAILKSKKSLCSGFSNILVYMCRELKIECVNINGYAKTSGRDLFVHADSMKNNHTWNAIKINNEWKLVDPTWASGYSDENCSTVVKEFAGNYFFMSPDKMILTHYPADSNWQLLDHKISKDEFLAQPVIHDAYYNNEISSFSPATGVIESTLNGLILFKFKSNKILDKIGFWSPDKSIPQEWGSLRKDGDEYVYYYYVKTKSDFMLNISINGGRTTLIYQVKVKSKKDRPA
ncbi:MAG: hypothetical protein C5B52_00580 [Bacteroidetes bacterium]|nr:MAG: hypothetical protein C5B52_00580 [Bacteroidota bacterium]